MLSRSGESRHPCFALDFGGKALHLSPLNIMFAVGFSHMVFMLSKFPFISSFWVFFFNHEKGFLSNAFLHQLRRPCVLFFLFSVEVANYVD